VHFVGDEQGMRNFMKYMDEVMNHEPHSAKPEFAAAHY